MATSTPKPLTPLLSLCEGDLLGGRYRIEELVRARSSGAHFEATDLTTGARVSAHVLIAPASETSELQDDARASFLAGAERAKTLKGPHVARVIEAGVTFEGHPWIVRQHLGSTTLAAHLREHGALTMTEAVDVALAVCDAISEAHEHGIVHGSIGPHCVHVAWSATGLVDIKVTGAGTASAEKALSLGSAREVEGFLRAPEQIQHGAHVDGRADVWTIGALLHTMLAGAPPFAADAPSGASLSVVLDDPPILTHIPAELAEMIFVSLAKDPAQRPHSPLDLAEAIVAFSSHPDFFRDRIASRRPADCAAIPPPLAVVPATATRTAPMFRPPPVAESWDALTPSVREIPVAGGKARTKSNRWRDGRTVITRRPEIHVGPSRGAMRLFGMAMAAFALAILVLAGTEGRRLAPWFGAAKTALVGGPASASPLPPARVEAPASAPPPAMTALPPAAPSAPVLLLPTTEPAAPAAPVPAARGKRKRAH